MAAKPAHESHRLVIIFSHQAGKLDIVSDNLELFFEIQPLTVIGDKVADS